MHQQDQYQGGQQYQQVLAMENIQQQALQIVDQLRNQPYQLSPSPQPKVCVHPLSHISLLPACTPAITSLFGFRSLRLSLP
jgi:hypothetical protein